MKVVMGIDPGAANLGFGVVRVEGSRMVALDGGVVETTPDQPMERRLERIHRALAELIEWHEPQALALEDVYFGKNVRSAMAVGQASGVAMLAAAQRGVRCFAYTPQAIKMAVCGSGSAGKKQVQRMVGTLLGLPEPPSPDHAADALAVAICHGGAAGHRQTLEALGAAAVPRRLAGAAGGMIAAVRGEVLVRRPDHVVIDAGGVGYRLAVSAETLKAVPATGREAFLHAELIARDDSLALYGFASEEERDLFRELISVSGVGPKVAIAALSGGAAARAAAGDRRRRREALPGGPGDRQADRRADHRRAAREGRRRARGGGRDRRRAGDDPRALARDGLVNLGYAPLEAEQLLDGVESDDPEELIAGALRAGRRARSAQHERTSRDRRQRIRIPDPHAGLPTTSEVRVHDARADGGDEELDRSLRPPTLADFVNQEQVTEQLAIFIEAARRRGEPLDHVLLAGPPGSARPRSPTSSPPSWGCRWSRPPGPALERKADVAAFLTALEPGSVFFIDEIHRLGRAVEETLYPAMEDGAPAGGARPGRRRPHGDAAACRPSR